jgi:hypothetical protein
MLREIEYAVERYWDFDGLSGEKYHERDRDNFEGDFAEYARQNDDARDVKRARFMRILTSARSIAGQILRMNLDINGMTSGDPAWTALRDFAVS